MLVLNFWIRTMDKDSISAKDFPVAETRPELVKGARGNTLDDLTLDAVVNGDVTMEDVRITPQSLLQQARIARDVGRDALAQNFERASEMTQLPQEEVMQVYELLRPGRAGSLSAMQEAASRLREEYGANRLADFVDEAGMVYEARGLFMKRY